MILPVELNLLIYLSTIQQDGAVEEMHSRLAAFEDSKEALTKQIESLQEELVNARRLADDKEAELTSIKMDRETTRKQGQEREMALMVILSW